MDYQTLKHLAFYSPVNQDYNNPIASSYNTQRPKVDYKEMVDYSVMWLTYVQRKPKISFYSIKNLGAFGQPKFSLSFISGNYLLSYSSVEQEIFIRY